LRKDLAAVGPDQGMEPTRGSARLLGVRLTLNSACDGNGAAEVVEGGLAMSPLGTEDGVAPRR